MLGRVGRIAPGVAFRPARALAAHPSGPGAAQSGVLHRFVRVDRDAMLRGALHDVEVVAHHILAREPLHPAIPILDRSAVADIAGLDQRHAMVGIEFRSEEHTSELQSLMRISYAVFCLKKKKTTLH